MKKILIIDDDPVFTEILSDQLVDRYELTVMHDGDQAVNILQKDDFNLVVTDILVPGRDGIEITQHLIKHKPEMPIIAVSGGGVINSDSYLDLARRFGVEHVHSKHEPITELIKMIYSLV